MLYIFICKYNTLTSNKFPAFGKAKNPFNKNVRVSPPSPKKGSVMFDEGDGIISSNRVFNDNYYELIDGGYYDIENNQPYYRDEAGRIKNSWSVNYIKK